VLKHAKQNTVGDLVEAEEIPKIGMDKGVEGAQRLEVKLDAF